MKRKLQRLFLSLAIMFVSSLAFAQQHTVTGTIVDETNFGMPGVTILELGTLNGAITDLDGNFSITVASPDATLEISYVGYRSIKIPINGRTKIDTKLQPAQELLDEVVVIGYGTQQKRVVTGSIASVGADEITSTPVLRVEQALQGRTPGVQVTNLSGQPGEAPTIRIRGAGTTGNADPLYVVDGMVVGGIDYLNPGDIESMDVLKDAASAAIYGARAANGVVLITTKKGTAGAMNVTYSGYYGIQNVAKQIDMLDAEQYRMLMNEGARNAGLSQPFDLQEIPKHNTNWQEALFVKNAPMTNHEISVTGGSDRSTYSSSVSYFSQEGIIGGNKSQFDRITARLNSTHQVNDKFRFGNNLSYSQITRRGIASNQSFNGAYSSALNMDPLTPIYEEDPDILAQAPYSIEPVLVDALGRTYGISRYVGAEVVNPLALLEIQTNETRVDKVVGNIFGELEMIEGLKFNTSLGIDLAFVMNDGHRPLFFLNGAQNNTDKTSVYKQIDRYFTWQWDNTLSYTKRINDHNFSLLVGTSAQKGNYENLYGFNAKVPLTDPNNVYLNMAEDTVWIATGGADHNSLASVFGRLTYDYQGRYALTAIIRRDGSSRFGPNNRYGTFPSVGVSWVMSEESFFPSLGPIDLVKFRASYGINGNENIGNWQFISTLNKSRGYIFAGGRMIGASPSYVENADIRWEQSEQFNAALDISGFDNRMTASVDYYIKTTKDLLEVIPIPGHVGNDPPVANVGSVQNKGIELAVNWRNYGRDLRYNVGVNASYNQNKMTKIGNEEGVLPGASWAIAGMVTRAEVGLPIGYFWGYVTDGIFQNQSEVFAHIGSTGKPLQPNAKPGDVRFVDVNGDGVINADDRTMIGNPTPAWTLGFNGNIEYKNFDFSVLIIGTYGNDVFNGAQRQDLRYTNRPVSALDRWTEEGSSNTVPRYTWIDVNNNYRVSDLYIEDGSFVRIKNVQLGYTIPRPILTRMGALNWRFYVSAENLFTLTKYTGPDPEIGAMTSFDIGIDRGIYPQARIFRVGTSITF